MGLVHFVRRLSFDRRSFGRAVIVSVVGLSVFYAEGLLFDLTPWAQSLVNAATSFRYPTTGQAKAVVVLFTEEDLATHAMATETAYPIPYRLHAATLRSIANAKPAAIFIDFAFVQRNRATAEGFRELTEAVCNAHNTVLERRKTGEPTKYTQVFVVDTSQLGIAGATTETFNGCAIPVGAFIDKEHVFNGVMTYLKNGESPIEIADAGQAADAPALPSGAAGVVGPRPVVAGCGCSMDPCGGGLSAAYALWLSTKPCSERKEALAGAGNRMAVIWPAKPAPPDTALDLCRKPPHLDERLRLIGEMGPAALKRGCPYSRTFTAGELLHPVTDYDVDPYLKNAVVLYGAKLAMSGDTVRSPVFSELPAIYYHAVAFDNLYSFDGKPKEPPGPRGLIAYGVALFLVTCVLSVVPMAKKPKLGPQQALERYGWAGKGAFLLVALLALGVIFQLTLETNAPEFLLLATFALFVVRRFAIAPLMGCLSLASFAISMALYVFLQLSFDKFLAVIVYFEIVHAMLLHLPDAASNVRHFYDNDPGRRLSYAERAALFVLRPFLFHKEHR